jgi:hypothetical protein
MGNKDELRRKKAFLKKKRSKGQKSNKAEAQEVDPRFARVKYDAAF